LFRIDTVEIRLPPLRDRREDIPVLAMHFLQRHAQRYRKPLTGFEPEAMEGLLTQPARQRASGRDRRAVLLAVGESWAPRLACARVTATCGDRSLDARRRRELIQRALRRFDGNVSDAAKALGLSRSALYRRLERHGL
jgi:DNA-binding NtrC family response regulator